MSQPTRRSMRPSQEPTNLQIFNAPMMQQHHPITACYGITQVARSQSGTRPAVCMRTSSSVSSAAAVQQNRTVLPPRLEVCIMIPHKWMGAPIVALVCITTYVDAPSKLWSESLIHPPPAKTKMSKLPKDCTDCLYAAAAAALRGPALLDCGRCWVGASPFTPSPRHTGCTTAALQCRAIAATTCVAAKHGVACANSHSSRPAHVLATLPHWAARCYPAWGPGPPGP